MSRTPVSPRRVDVPPPFDLARDYPQAHAKRGVPARFVGVPGAGHNGVVRRPEVRAAIDEPVYVTAVVSPSE